MRIALVPIVFLGIRAFDSPTNILNPQIEVFRASARVNRNNVYVSVITIFSD